MDQKSLTAFLMLAEELQFSRAAQRLGVTQSALSQQIAKLESELGVQLFDRNKRVVKLAESGKMLRENARSVLSEMDKAVKTARRAALGELGKLSVAYVDAAPFSLLSPIIMHYRKLYPDVRLELLEMSSSEQYQALVDRKIDIGLLRPVYSIEEVEEITLLKEPYVVAMNREHPLAEFSDVHIRLLINEKFLFTSVEKARYISHNFSDIFKRHGMVPEVVQEVNQLHALLSLVGAGLGISLLPLSVALNNNHGVVYRLLTGVETPSAKLKIAWKKNNTSKLVEKFVKSARHCGMTWNS